MKALVFDLDGTLVDTKYDMLDAGNLVFENQGWATRLEGFSGLQTAIQGGRAILRYGLQEEGITFNDKLLTDYYQLYLNNYNKVQDDIPKQLRNMMAEHHRKRKFPFFQFRKRTNAAERFLNDTLSL